MHNVFFDNQLHLPNGPFRLRYDFHGERNTEHLCSACCIISRRFLFLSFFSSLSYEMKHLRPCIRALAKAEMSNVRINREGQLAPRSRFLLLCSTTGLDRNSGAHLPSCCAAATAALRVLGLLSIQHVIGGSGQASHWIEFFVAAKEALEELGDAQPAEIPNAPVNIANGHAQGAMMMNDEAAAAAAAAAAQSIQRDEDEMAREQIQQQQQQYAYQQQYAGEQQLQQPQTGGMDMRSPVIRGM
jgi:hypothetical protein